MKCRIHLGGIITEGSDRAFLEVKPAPYNVVLEDDTYRGQIKIGFKFIANVRMVREKVEYNFREKSHFTTLSQQISSGKLLRVLIWTYH